MLTGSNLFSSRQDWWIWLELKDGSTYDIHWPGRPFVGTELQKDIYVEHLAEQSMIQGLPVREINVCPIKRAR